MDPEPLLQSSPRPRLRVAVGAVVILVLLGLGAAVVAAMLSPHGGAALVTAAPLTIELPSGDGLDGGAEAGPRGVLVVQVLGAVLEPGVYQLREGARVLDAVAAAGGFAEDAARAALNLAAGLQDGQQLLVPVEGEAPAQPAPAQPGAGPPPAPGLDADGRVNLNTADAATLVTLPRIGPAMAARIIAYRERHGRFRAVQDLLAISGIGEKTFAALRPLVTV